MLFGKYVHLLAVIGIKGKQILKIGALTSRHPLD